MVWFKVDDGWHSHPKVIGVSLAARGLWATAGSWCSQHLTDGAVPEKMLKMWGASAKLAGELVAAGLWETSDTGYRFHDWSALNPLRSAVLESRASDAKRKRDARANPPGRPPGHTSDSGPTPLGPAPESSRARPRSRPDPTQPDPASAARSCDAAAVAAFFAPGAENRPSPAYSPEAAVWDAWEAAMHGGRSAGTAQRVPVCDVLRVLADRKLGTDVLAELIRRWASGRSSSAPPRFEYFARDIASLLDVERPRAAAPSSTIVAPVDRPALCEASLRSDSSPAAVNSRGSAA